MSNRCPNCNKFVSLEPQDPEVMSIDIGDDDGEVTCSVRLVLACAECGEELRDFEFELSEIPSGIDACIDKHEDECAFSIAEYDSGYDERFQTKDSKGKAIPHRYQKHFYSVFVNAVATCTICGEDYSMELTDECLASDMNDLV